MEFSDLPGWDDDHISEAIPALLQSCVVLEKQVEKWKVVCADARKLPPQDDVFTRAFFEHWFLPYAASGNNGAEGLFTGYYEAELRGSFQRGGVYQTPLYARPDDLITADLGAFKADLKGQHIVGKVEGAKFIPYDDHAAIAAGSLEHRAKVLLWVDDPVDAFFLAVQGSGRVRMTDGTTQHVGYDGANGRAYVAIGPALADMGELEKPVTMQAIRAWLKAHPDRARDIMNLNPSYVFFRLMPNGAVGAEGVPLTPQRSLAVDPAFVPLGTPVWVDIEGSGVGGQGVDNLRRLVVAQDTGGAIKGPVRGDVFWGFGVDAAAQAGAMQNFGRYYVLQLK